MVDTGVLRAAVALLTGLAFTGAAMAQSDKTKDLDTGNDPLPFKEEDRAVSYASVGVSYVSTMVQNVSEAVNLDGTLGLRIPGLTWISGEIVGSFTVVPGKYRGPQSCTSREPSPPPPLGSGDAGGTDCEPGIFTRSTNDFQMTNAAALAVLRTPGVVYVVGKGGYRIINSSIPEIQEGDDRDGPTWTAGAGFRWNQGLSSLEATYTEYSSQIDYYGLTVLYGFGASPGRGAR